MNFTERINFLPDLQKQLIKFFMIGVLATLVDLFVYWLLLKAIPIFTLDINFIVEHFHPDNKDLSKSLSFVIGSLVTYNLNKFWTWKQTDRSNKRFVKFYTLYGFSLIINVLINKLSLSWLPDDVPFKFLIAFTIATGTSAIFNFIGQKLWVFSTKD